MPPWVRASIDTCSASVTRPTPTTSHCLASLRTRRTPQSTTTSFPPVRCRRLPCWPEDLVRSSRTDTASGTTFRKGSWAASSRATSRTATESSLCSVCARRTRTLRRC
uniref:(northern house mosquito) hypothetical protein n=1 Tax=Culex pipiens TaxID=7175 RepID=A0A8D8CJ11_CULPI